MSQTVPEYYSLSLIRMMVSLQDMLFNFDDITLFKSESLWTVERGPTQILDFADSEVFLGVVEISLSQDLIHYERSVYTLLDLLSDIGGI